MILVNRVFIIAGLCFGILLAQESNFNEETLRRFLDVVTEDLSRSHDTIYTNSFAKKPEEYEDILPFLKFVAKKISLQTKEFQKFNISSVRNPALKQELKNLRRSAYLYILGEDYFEKFEKIVTQMMETAYAPNLCEYNDKSRCNLVYLVDARNIMNNHEDPEEMKHYWEQYRNNNEFIGQSLFPEFIELWIKAAEESGLTPFEFLYSRYGGIDIGDNMKLIMDEIMPFYKEFHAVVRHKLNQKYGEEVISKTGLIPHHLFEMITLQAWKKESALEHAYPDKRLPNILSGMEKRGVDAERILRIAEMYYKSMGFEPLPQDVRENFVRLPSKDRFQAECRGRVYDRTQTLKLEYCPQVHFKKFLQMHGYLGKIHYAQEKRNLPFTLHNSYNYEDAVGEAVILSASSPYNIVKNGFVEPNVYTPENQMNRLFRMGVHTWFNLPAYYVHIKLLEDLLLGVTNFNDINIHYWKLMEEYAGVEPPVDRNITSFDLPVKFYEDIKLNRLISKFASEILGYQFYDKLCKLSSRFNENTQDLHPLHNCNLEGSSIVAQALTQMMKVGSLESWRKTLQIFTGNDKGLTSEGILNYYKPLRGWIQEELQKHDIAVGWGKTSKALDAHRNIQIRSMDLPSYRYVKSEFVF